MPTDLTVILHDKPGELARVGQVAGEAGVHIRGMAAFTGEGRGVVHVLVDDGEVEQTVAALKAAHLRVADEREVLVVDLDDRPGSLGELARELADANVNVELAYPTFTNAQLVIATDDMRSARSALA
ncbi:MAG: ACT domain-containing protein [Solirubrobacteraceae bacterium]